MFGEVAFSVSLLVAALAACSEGADDLSQVADSTDVYQQEVNPAVMLPLREEMRLGGGIDRNGLFRISAAAMSESGQIVVLDAGNHELAIFSVDGERVRTIGGRGRGPGEFAGPGSLWVRNDTIAVSDAGNRLHLFSTDGSLISTRAFHRPVAEDGYWGLGNVVGTDKGWFVRGFSSRPPDTAEVPGRPPPFQRQVVFRILPDSGLERQGFSLEHQLPGEWLGSYFVEPPFAHRPRVAMDGLGRLHVARTGSYTLGVFDTEGNRLYTLENDIKRERVTDALLERWHEENLCRPTTEDCLARRALALKMATSEFRPIVAEIVAFTNGHIAVRRHGTDPDPTDRLLIGEFDMFGPEGQYLGRLPVGTSPRWFDGRTLLATEWDELMVPSLVQYAVVAQR